MTMSSESPTLSEELRERAGAFVNSHVGLWVTVEDEGVLILAGNAPGALFEAAADWLKEGPDYAVAGAVWTRQPGEPGYVMRLTLGPPESA
jgi:hypothetical protein